MRRARPGANMPIRICCCCGALRPRFKRLVDNIFPEDPKDGLVKGDMEKLTFYAVSAPEKLDRIGTYLADKLTRDVVRHRTGNVLIAMEALDQLLMACHSQSIKPFVESFLHMVAKLLESGEPQLQMLGTNSFVKFANIEEDTPSYHRRYDFFVSRFSAMCHSSYDDPEIQREIRVAGIRGIQGVVRKTVNDELQATIWEPQHMDKIVPSLLFNMQKLEDVDSRIGPPSSPDGDKEENPAVLAENCFRELLGRATYGNMSNAVRPVFDILPGIGPTVLEVFNTLLKHLRLSVEFEAGERRGSMGSVNVSTSTKDNDERIVQNAIIQTIGFFGSNLPDYQRSEIMMFIMGKVPVFGTTTHTLDTSQLGDLGTRRIQIMLLRSLLMVTSGYKAKTIVTALPAPFLDPILSPSLMEDYELRQLVLEIMHNLIDRHDNRAKLRGIRIIPDVADLKIKREKISKQDASFMKKNGQQLYRHIYLGCKEDDNVQKNFELLYTSLALITIELANEEVVIDLIRVAIALQDNAIVNEDNLPMFHRCAMMALVAAYLNFLSQMIAVPAFCQHVSKVIEIRTMEAPYFLPEHIFRDKCMLPKSLEKHEKNLYFLTNKIAESLGGSGYNVEKLTVPYVPQVTDEDRLSRRKSIVDTVSIQVDILPGSNPIDNMISTTTEEITFEALKKAIDTNGMEEQEKEKRRLVIEKFQKAPFEEIAAQCETKANFLHDRLAQILELTIRPPPSPSGTLTITSGHAQYQSVPVYEMKFPDLCVY
ncbi:protein EFR3 homolog A [Gracilinanus agilis]|uniref:protein EFR3 homolog A n=1 Tax=Gracilinanus agilis TaxID=191870 RepID=UPI001CFD126A|nr:protein EFR3 homolog A [Gracilinanus agilis]